MFNSKKIRLAAFLAFLLLFALGLGFCLYLDGRVCMGVRILTEKQQADIQEYIYLDLSCALVYNDQPAAVDVDASTIYIPQNIQPGTEIKDLQGKLNIADSGYQLSFAPDEAFSDLASAVAEGHAFKLNIMDNVYRCMQYRVVFTTLPVLRMDGAVTHQNEAGRDVMDGTLCLWTPEDPDTGRYSVKSSHVQWHVRGYTAATLDKLSWKLTLKKENGDNRNLSFGGLGADDDWILNAMRFDDTKLKEKLFMDLWNTRADAVCWNDKMSSGTYVEVIQNHSYAGVYLLQRRIDRKYCNLPETDILLKSRNVLSPGSMQEAYEIVHSPLGEEETLKPMEGVFTGTDYSMLRMDNFLDTDLFVLYGSAIDNAGFKNIFYHLQNQGDTYQLSLIPWDTDMSWGVTFTNGFTYDYAKSMSQMIHRQEYYTLLREHPELDALLASRWKELRQSVFAEDHILGILKKNQAQLEQSGALHRENKYWGSVFEDDTQENLSQFLLERLALLDTYYAQ